MEVPSEYEFRGLFRRDYDLVEEEEKADTLINLLWDARIVGTYEDGCSGVIALCDLTIKNMRNKRTIKKHFEGTRPPEKKLQSRGYSSIYGEYPTQKIKDYLIKLIKESIISTGKNAEVINRQTEKEKDESIKRIIALEQEKVSKEISEAKYERLIKEGIELARNGKFQESIKIFEEASKVIPNNAKAVYNMGINFCKLREFEEAINCYEKALKNNPRFADACYNKALIEEQLGRKTEALKSFRDFLAIAPTDWIEEINYANKTIKKLDLSN